MRSQALPHPLNGAHVMMQGVLDLRAVLRRSGDAWIWSDICSLLTDKEVADLLADWPPWARPDQAPSDIWTRRWQHWLILGGRGSGKTRAGAEWVRAKVLGQDWAGAKAGRVALVGGSLDEARAVMVEGISGLLAVHDGDEVRPDYEPSKRRLTWPNGAMAQLFSGEDPDSLRGPQFDAAWCDELAKWRYPQAAWDMLQFGLRLGSPPQVAITTTPRPLPMLKRMIGDPGLVVSRSETWRNEGNLAPEFIAEMKARYRGTRLGRQELEAEIIADDPDALFRRDWIEGSRVAAAPELRRIVIAIDPPAGKAGSACGIIAAGVGADGRAYVLDDATVERRSPAQWAARAVALYHARGADRIVAEVNQGGAMVEAVLREVDRGVAYKPVSASRGKRARAEPVAALYEQRRVSHVGAFPALEDEMCTWTGEGEGSPDRLDALVWALSELMLGRKMAEPRVWFV
jgi:phage terminase large subunit-like protein